MRWGQYPGLEEELIKVEARPKIHYNAPMENIRPDKRLDARGMTCPMPSVKTALALEDMSPGEVIEVITDDPVSKKDLPLWASGTGNTVLEVVERVIEGKEAITIYVRKGSGQ